MNATIGLKEKVGKAGSKATTHEQSSANHKTVILALPAPSPGSIPHTSLPGGGHSWGVQPELN